MISQPHGKAWRRACQDLREVYVQVWVGDPCVIGTVHTQRAASLGALGRGQEIVTQVRDLAGRVRFTGIRSITRVRSGTASGRAASRSIHTVNWHQHSSADEEISGGVISMDTSPNPGGPECRRLDSVLAVAWRQGR